MTDDLDRARLFLQAGQAAQADVDSILDTMAGHVAVFDEDLNWSVEHTDECREGPIPMSQCPASKAMLAMSGPPVSDPGRYRMRLHRGAVLFDEDENARPRGLMQLVELAMTKWGSGSVGISHDPQDGDGRQWSVTIFMGEEEPGSGMVGGAAHGIAGTMRQALRQALDETGLR